METVLWFIFAVLVVDCVLLVIKIRLQHKAEKPQTAMEAIRVFYDLGFYLMAAGEIVPFGDITPWNPDEEEKS